MNSHIRYLLLAQACELRAMAIDLDIAAGMHNGWDDPEECYLAFKNCARGLRENAKSYRNRYFNGDSNGNETT